PGLSSRRLNEVQGLSPTATPPAPPDVLPRLFLGRRIERFGKLDTLSGLFLAGEQDPAITHAHHRAVVEPGLEAVAVMYAVGNNDLPRHQAHGRSFRRGAHVMDSAERLPACHDLFRGARLAAPIGLDLEQG